MRSGGLSCELLQVWIRLNPPAAPCLQLLEDGVHYRQSGGGVCKAELLGCLSERCEQVFTPAGRGYLSNAGLAAGLCQRAASGERRQPVSGVMPVETG